MLERVKRAVVESYIGAIALGYLLAQVILYFASIFAAPISAWVTETRFQGTANVPPPHLALQDAYPEIVSFVLSLAIWYLLLRWLYMKPARSEASESAPESH